MHVGPRGIARATGNPKSQEQTAKAQEWSDRLSRRASSGYPSSGLHVRLTVPQFHHDACTWRPAVLSRVVSITAPLVALTFGWELSVFSGSSDGAPPLLTLVTELALGVALAWTVLRAPLAATRGAALLAIAGGLRLVGTFGIPLLGSRHPRAEHPSLLAARFGRTVADVPLEAGLALAAVMAGGGVLYVMARDSSLPAPVGTLLALTPALLGVAVVLGYGTGSPWPLLP